MKKSKFEKLIKETQENLAKILENVHELNSNIKPGTYYKDRLGSFYSTLNEMQTVIADINRGAIDQSRPEFEVFGLNQIVDLEDDE